MNSENPGSTPGVMAALTGGFELATSHIWLIVLPIALDLLYWLGPRLQVDELLTRTIAALEADVGQIAFVEQSVSMAPQVNLLSTLSLPLIGVPTLMGGPIPELTPLTTSAVQIDSMSTWMILYLALSVVGLLLASVYLGSVGWMLHAREKPDSVGPLYFIRRVIRQATRLFGAVLVFLLLLITVCLPLMPIAIVLSLIGAGGLALLVLLLGLVLLVIYMSMVVPSLMYAELPVVEAVMHSLRLVHRYRLQTALLLFTILIVNMGLDSLWQMADYGTWLTLASVAAHAFVSTGLVAALFLFYRDRAELLERPIQRASARPAD
ncbi:MAG: hypothetical protein R3300_22330 [Candidatus Promineifilaceae bacterium]|nr:hypothetical protein [Candidatus Promineifilaceae bacterium]